jgi:predicted Zn-dependent protease
MRRGRIKASREIEEALRLSPNDVGVLISYFYVSQMPSDQAGGRISYLERAMHLDPNNAQTYDELGEGLLRFGRHAEAIRALEKCLQLDPGDGGCLRKVVTAQFAANLREDALETLRRFEVESGGVDGNSGNLMYLTYGYGLLDQQDKAREMFDALSARASEQYIDPIVWAWAYMGVGDYEEALPQLNAAADNFALIQNLAYSDTIAWNNWRDTKLEEGEFAVVRARLRNWDS